MYVCIYISLSLSIYIYRHTFIRASSCICPQLLRELRRSLPWLAGFRQHLATAAGRHCDPPASLQKPPRRLAQLGWALDCWPTCISRSWTYQPRQCTYTPRKGTLSPVCPRRVTQRASQLIGLVSTSTRLTCPLATPVCWPTTQRRS